MLRSLSRHAVKIHQAPPRKLAAPAYLPDLHYVDLVCSNDFRGGVTGVDTIYRAADKCRYAGVFYYGLLFGISIALAQTVW